MFTRSIDLGQAHLNLTFADGNYTDMLRLEATIKNYSGIGNVGFLSNTPVVMTMTYFADLNGDGTVNILDISLAAKAYGTKPGDSKWDANADVNEDRTINILDISAIAKEYGKTTQLPILFGFFCVYTLNGNHSIVHPNDRSITRVLVSCALPLFPVLSERSRTFFYKQVSKILNASCNITGCLREIRRKENENNISFSISFLDRDGFGFAFSNRNRV